MAEPLRVLVLEDNPADAELVQFELEEAGFVFTARVVMTEEDFLRELQEFSPDLILSDYDLPRYNGAQALVEAKRRCPDIPFILVTGAVTEDRAIDILTQGAKDYVLKNRLEQRLVPAVRRALAEAEEHRARKQAEAELREAHRTLEQQVTEKTSELRESRERLSLALTSSRMGIFEWNVAENKRYWDENVHRMLGTNPENFSGTAEEFFGIMHPDDRQAVQTTLKEAVDEDVPYEAEYRAMWPDGSIHHIATRGKLQRDGAGRPLRITGVCWEITERRRAEERLRRQAELLNLASEAIFMWELDGAIIYWSDGAARLYGYSGEEAVGRVSHDLLKTRHPQGFDHIKSLLTENKAWTGELVHTTKDGRTIAVESRHQLIKDESGRQIVLETTRDVTARKKAEDALRESERRYSALFANKINGMAHCRIITDEHGRPVDYYILQINEAYERIIGIKKADIEGRRVKEVFPGIENYAFDYIGVYGKIALEGGEIQFEEFFEATQQYLSIYAYSPLPGEFAAIFTDVTERKLAEESLRKSEDRLRLALEGADLGTWELDLTNDIAVRSLRHDQIFGYEELQPEWSLETALRHVLPEDRKIVQESHAHPDETGGFSIEVRVRRPDGSIHWINSRGRFHYDSEGRPVRIVGVVADITERRRTEEELQRQRELLHVTLSSIGDAVIATDTDGRVSFMNAIAERLTGWSLRDASMRPVTEVFNIVNEHTRQIVESPVTKVLREGAIVGLANHTILVRKDGTEVPIDDSGAPIRDADGKTLGVVLVFRDIAARRRNEEILQTTLHRLSTLVSSMRGAVLLVGESKIALANQTFCDYFRLRESPADLAGLTPAEMMEKIENVYRYPDEALSRIQEIVSQDRPVVGEEVALREGRTCLRDYVPISVDGKSYGRLWYHTDITAQKRTEEALGQSEERYRGLFDTMQEGFFVAEAVLDESGKPSDLRYLIVNHTMERLTKRTREQLVNHTYRELWADAGQEWIAILGKVALTGEPAFVDGYGQGTGLWLQVQAYSPLYGQVAAIINDVTERKQAEEALRLSEEKFATAFANNPAAIALTRLDDGLFLEVNDTWVALSGFSREEAIGHSAREMGIWPTTEVATRFMQELGEKGFLHGWEQEFRRKSGEFFVAQLSAQLLTMRGEKVILSTLVDITKRRQAEDDLATQAALLQERAAQLEAVNKELESFSYSVSHDLKAPLRAIEGYSRMFMKKYGSTLDQDAARLLEVIHGSTESMARLIDDLLAFSRVLKSDMTISEIDMEKLAKEVWTGIREANPEREIELRMGKMLPGFGDPTLITQVLTNLVSNAVKFTKDRKPGIVEISSYSETGKVVYGVKDNGLGFDMAFYDKLFGVFQRLHSHEEFEGTGVGLAIVQRIIERHGGRVWAEGEIDKGATFYFTLPRK